MQIKINEIINEAINVYVVDENYKINTINSSLSNYLESNKVFDGEKLSTFRYINDKESFLLVGLGNLEKISINDFRKVGFNIAKELSSNKLNKANINYISLNKEKDIDFINALTEGLLQFEYKFDTYKTKDIIKSTDLEININTDLDFNSSNVEYLTNIVDGINLTRDLVNIPAIDMYPEVLAKKAKEVLEPLGVKVTIYNEKEIKDLGMTAFLAVAAGSDKEPKFIKMEYSPVNNGEVIALVGKGLTYDSGGYAIKPATSMDTMMSDMGGSGTVIGTIYALSKNKIQQNVVGLVASCENMISGKAYKNGDIVRSMKGTTIEVKNTDAEGRVTLADSLYYAATKTDATTIVDLATLTGACVVALGELTTGIVTNDDDLYSKIEKASFESGEYVWKFPVFEETREMLKGKVGDLSNSPGRYGGAITAGIFLEEFVEGKTWAHMDIAGPAYCEAPYSYIPYGATGIPVKTLYNFVLNFK